MWQLYRECLGWKETTIIPGTPGTAECLASHQQRYSDRKASIHLWRENKIKSIAIRWYRNVIYVRFLLTPFSDRTLLTEANHATNHFLRYTQSIVLFHRPAGFCRLLPHADPTGQPVTFCHCNRRETCYDNLAFAWVLVYLNKIPTIPFWLDIYRDAK